MIPSDLDERFDQLVATEAEDPDQFERLQDTLSRRYLKAAPELYAKLADYIDRERADFSEREGAPKRDSFVPATVNGRPRHGRTRTVVAALARSRTCVNRFLKKIETELGSGSDSVSS